MTTNETNEQRLQKLQTDRNFNSLVKDQNSFENKVKQTEDAQKMIFNKIQQSKSKKLKKEKENSWMDFISSPSR